MRKESYRNERIIYYSDELNDDFNDVGLKRNNIPQKYRFKFKNPIMKVVQSTLYYGLAKPVLSVGCFFNGVKLYNRKKLKEIRKNHGSVFLYGNHVAIMDAFKVQAYLIHKRCNIIGYSDTLSLGLFISFLAKCFGYLPLPSSSDILGYKKLYSALEECVKNGEHVVIFPEAHIWPYYTKIRDFKSGSFHYPAKLNVPVMPFVTVWRKVWWRKKPCQTVVFGDIIYPKKEYSVKENRDYLYEECIKQMKNISNKFNQYEYVKYIHEEENK